jgi:ribosomal protein S6
MPSYEHVFLARQDLSQAQVDALAEAAVKIVEDHKGSVARTETWGLKQLAYKIEKNRKAHYVLPSWSGRLRSTKISSATSPSALRHTKTSRPS